MIDRMININRQVKKGIIDRLDNGLYILSSTRDIIKETNFLNTKSLTVIVHDGPFYQSNEINPEYKNRVNEIIKKYTSPVLIAVEAWHNSGYDNENYKSNEEEVLEWIQSLNPEGPRLFYLTQGPSSKPLFPKTESLVDCIKKTFGPEEIVVCGAELSIYKNPDTNTEIYGSCVGGTYNLFAQHFSTKLYLSHCWITENSTKKPNITKMRKIILDFKKVFKEIIR